MNAITTETPTAQPTVYNGIAFRSKLEATWAAMFDQLGWAWVYEPHDLAGYIPDFMIYGSGGRGIYVEVKPDKVYRENRADILAKAFAAIGDTRLMVVTDDLWQDESVSGSAVIGYLPKWETGPDGDSDDHAILNDLSDHFDICECWGDWTMLLSGEHYGNHYPTKMKTLWLLWSRARNAVRWMPKS